MRRPEGRPQPGSARVCLVQIIPDCRLDAPYIIRRARGFPLLGLGGSLGGYRSVGCLTARLTGRIDRRASSPSYYIDSFIDSSSRWSDCGVRTMLFHHCQALATGSWSTLEWVLTGKEDWYGSSPTLLIAYLNSGLLNISEAAGQAAGCDIISSNPTQEPNGSACRTSGRS